MLSVTAATVKLFQDDGVFVGRVSAEQAVPIAKSGMYEGLCSHKLNRVYSLYKIKAQKKDEGILMYRDGRAMLQPYGIQDVSCWTRWAGRKKFEARTS